MRRFCPSEEILGEFVSGCIPSEERDELEKHIAECNKCRTLVAEAYQAINCPDIHELKTKAAGFVLKNLWLMFGVLAFLASFVLSGYFFQFLMISLICSVKWIADNRNSKTLIMIQEGRKASQKTPSNNFYPDE